MDVVEASSVSVARRRTVTRIADVDHGRLIAAIAARRDRDAFAELFQHFAPRLKAYLLRAGATGGVAEDFAQDAMLTVWRKADLFDPARASAATWIFTIARNRRIDALRRVRHEPPSPDLSLMPDDPARPDEIMQSGQDAARVRAALAELPPEQVQLIEMSFFQERPHAQIAVDMNLPLGTVKSRIRAGMQRLRFLLERSEGDAR